MDLPTISAVFMGSPDFAVPSLIALHKHFRLHGIVTQPDQPSGRGRSIKHPEVKTAALELALPIIQPRRLQNPDAMEQLRLWSPDIIVVAAFGQILRQEVLDLPKYGCINVHASLLPRWRGAAPIQACIASGDEETGVTIMKMDAGIDTGPILSQRSVPIKSNDTADSLSRRLAQIGAELLIDTLPGFLRGILTLRPQDGSLATYAPMLKKTDGQLDFNETSATLERKVRAYLPWPGAYTYWKGEILKIQRASTLIDPLIEVSYQPGQRLVYQSKPAIATSEGLLILEELQPAGKRTMSGSAFLTGARDWP